MRKTLFTIAIVMNLFGCNKQTDITPSPTTDDFSLSQSSVNDFSKLIVPLNQQEPLKLTDKELQYFDDLSNAQIIGLGEATHGTKEFFQMKHRLFKYFVEHFNHKNIAFEMDFSEALIFDEYIQTGQGDIEALMKDNMFFWTWATSEVKDLLIWMKEYNIGKSDSEKLHIYGVDCQTFYYNIRELVKRVSKIDNKMGQDIAGLLAGITTLKFEGRKADILAVNTLIKNNKAQLIAGSSLFEYDFIEHISDILIQTEAVVSDSNFASSNANRDLFMGENVVWLKKHSNYPMSVWAHNEHVKNTVSFSEQNRTMGFHINNKLQGGYFNVGFSFSEGSVTAVNYDTNTLGYFVFPDGAVKGFLNELFSKSTTPNFMYKSSSIYRNTSIREFLQTKPFYQIGAVFYPNTALLDMSAFRPIIEDNFSYMIHFKKTSHSDNYFVK